VNRRAPGPLSGYKVVDLTANMTGPYATMLLAEQGAHVIKVEPAGGEVIRRVGTGRDGLSAYFANLNRSKQSIVMDLSMPDAVAALMRIVADADVFVQNFRPGVVESLGVGPDDVCSVNPSIVYASISGFGRVGPLAGLPAYDHVVQALSGMAARQADGRGGPPALVRHGLVDKVTGLFAAQSITAALLGRAKSGSGGRIEIAMLDAAIHFLWPDGMMNHTCLDDDVVELPPISAGFRLTETADGHVAMITVTDAQWAGMLKAVELDAVFDQPDFRTVEGRMRNGGRVMREVAQVIRTLATDEVVERMRFNDVPCMPVVDLEDVATHPQVVAAGVVERTEHPLLGPIVQPRPPARFIDDGEPERFAARVPGEDTDSVLAAAGFGADEIGDLRERGAVA
jgi:crotonobetainyl-CoA:carnitine CoA-transferase CaiB-like acyl-CoA transferase